MLRIFSFSLLISILCVLNLSNTLGQIGGQNTFNFVRLPSNAHLLAVSGMNVSVRSINMITQNPALISKEMSKQLAMSNMQYYGGINTSSLSYVHQMGKLGPLGVNLNYYTSGKIDQVDETGTITGSYSVNQYFVSAGTAHQIDYYSLGAQVKFAGSNIGGYQSNALLFDIGGTFKHPHKDFTVGLVLQNMGVTLKQYTDVKQTLPFDVQLGMSYKLEHMPLRFSLLAHHLHTFDIVYLDPNKKQPLDADGKPIVEKKSLGDKILRHFNIGGEFFLGKAIRLRVGYNHLVRREMRNDARSGMAGFAFGAAININAFELSYSRDWQHLAGGFNCLTLNTNFEKLLTKKTKNIPLD